MCIWKKLEPEFTHALKNVFGIVALAAMLTAIAKLSNFNNMLRSDLIEHLEILLKKHWCFKNLQCATKNQAQGYPDKQFHIQVVKRF